MCDSNEFFEVSGNRTFLVRKSGKKTTKREIAAFSMSVENVIEAGPRTGFIVQVTCALSNISRNCFLSQHALSSTLDKFNNELRHSFGCQGGGSGGLVHTMTAKLVNKFFLQEIENFATRCKEDGSDSDPLTAATSVGRQKGTNIWVLTPDVQLYGDGTPIQLDNKKYAWIEELLPRGSKAIHIPESLGRFNECEVLHDIYLSLAQTLHENALSAFYAIGCACMMLHYETMIEVFKMCPIPIILGDVNTGKTSVARMASQIMGCGDRLMGFARDRYLPRQTSGTSFPPILDDTDATGLEDILTKYFNGGMDVTCNSESIPRTAPLITANWFYLDRLVGNRRAMSRVVIIPFCKQVRRGGQGQVLAEIARAEVEERAVHALPALIALGKDIESNKREIMTTYRSKVENATNAAEIEDRLFTTYGALLFITERLLQKAGVAEFPPSCAEEYLREVVSTKAILRYQVSWSDASSVEPECSAVSPPLHDFDIFKAVATVVTNASRGELLTAINPRVSLKTGEIGLAFSLDRLIGLFEQKSIPCPPRHVWRKEMKEACNIKRGMQVFLNNTSDCDAITRGGPSSSNPVNKSGTWIPYTCFSDSQLQLLDEVFKTGGALSTGDQNIDEELKSQPPSPLAQTSSPPNGKDNQASCNDDSQGPKQAAPNCTDQLQDPSIQSSSRKTSEKQGCSLACHDDMPSPTKIGSREAKRYKGTTSSSNQEPSREECRINTRKRTERMTLTNKRLNFEGQKANVHKRDSGTSTEEYLAAPISSSAEENKDDVCNQCGLPEPKGRNKTKDIQWIACDVCDRWFHLACLSISKENIGPKVHFQCRKCK